MLHVRKNEALSLLAVRSERNVSLWHNHTPVPGRQNGTAWQKVDSRRPTGKELSSEKPLGGKGEQGLALDLVGKST